MALTTSKDKLLSDDEMERLLLAIVAGQGEVTQEQAQRVIDWAAEARIDAGLLRLVLEGTLAIKVRDDGELEFRRRNNGTDES